MKKKAQVFICTPSVSAISADRCLVWITLVKVSARASAFSMVLLLLLLTSNALAGGTNLLKTSAFFCTCLHQASDVETTQEAADTGYKPSQLGIE